MVKPAKRGPIRRRLLTVSLYSLAWVLLTVSSPVWVPLAFLIGLIRRRSFVLLRLLLFGWFYFGFELIALILVAWTMLSRPRGEPRQQGLFRLQNWWANVNLRVAARALKLHFAVEGVDCAVPGPSILLVRHASILDTLLPSTFVQKPFGYRVRYILKQELLFDPCIDIVGNALPNYFIDRTGDTAEELEGIRALAEGLGSEGIPMFPEGTRFSPEKREKAIRRLEREGSPFTTPARELSHVLPPKPGGVLALIDALPNVDCVFFAHTGLEAFAKVKDLLSGDVVGSTVRVRAWRVGAEEIPLANEDRLRWLYSEWAKVNTFVRNMPETS